MNKKKKIKLVKETIDILYKISQDTGYSFYFENVDISLNDDKLFIIKGITNDNMITVTDKCVGL